jgi:uncharacterized protein
MEAHIRAALDEVAASHHVRVLYACESGSRAWGFASPDSDYDVRFFYVHPRDWYLSIDPGRDVIEAMLPGDLDLSGWDLRKTLGLMRKSNPALIEWLRSPIVYSENKAFIGEFRNLSAEWLSLPTCFRHYLHMAEGNWKAYLLRDAVLHKKYLYVLRPVLAARWIERHREPAPMEFQRLMAVSPDEGTTAAIDELLRVKMTSSEMETGPPIAALHEFLERELARLGSLAWPREGTPDTELLNQFFRRWLV